MLIIMKKIPLKITVRNLLMIWINLQLGLKQEKCHQNKQVLKF